jgi:hypothetical protein
MQCNYHMRNYVALTKNELTALRDAFVLFYVFHLLSRSLSHLEVYIFAFSTSRFKRAATRHANTHPGREVFLYRFSFRNRQGGLVGMAIVESLTTSACMYVQDRVVQWDWKVCYQISGVTVRMQSVFPDVAWYTRLLLRRVAETVPLECKNNA